VMRADFFRVHSVGRAMRRMRCSCSREQPGGEETSRRFYVPHRAEV